MWNEVLDSGAWWEGHVAVTWALVGLIWTVQLAVYPQFAWVDPARFVRWHATYTRRIGLVVGPLMGVEGVTGAIWVILRPEDAWAWIGLGLIAVIWGCTAAVQMPLHRRLGQGFDRERVTLLVRSNWVRTLIWTVRGVLVSVAGWG